MRNLKKILMIMILIPSSLLSAGDYNSGKEKSQICAACHGIDGISQIKTYPILAGQHKNYLVPQVLTNVNHDMEFMMEENFGPCVGIMRVKNEDQAIE